MFFGLPAQKTRVAGILRDMRAVSGRAIGLRPVGGRGVTHVDRLAVANLIQRDADHEQTLADRVGAEIEEIVADGKIGIVHRRGAEIEGCRGEIPIGPAGGAGAGHDILRAGRSDAHLVNAGEASSRAGAAKLHEPDKAVDPRHVTDDLIATQAVVEQVTGSVLGRARGKDRRRIELCVARAAIRREHHARVIGKHDHVAVPRSVRVGRSANTGARSLRIVLRDNHRITRATSLVCPSGFGAALSPARMARACRAAVRSGRRADGPR